MVSMSLLHRPAFILDYNKYRMVTGYHYTSLSLSMKQTSATSVASVSHAGGALHMMSAYL
jgi:hypothetical protein